MSTSIVHHIKGAVANGSELDKDDLVLRLLLHRSAPLADQVLQALSHEPVEKLAISLGKTVGLKAAQLHMRLTDVARGTNLAWKARHWRLAAEVAGDSSKGKGLQLFARSRFN